MIGRNVILMIGIVMAAIVCCSCSSGGDTPAAGAIKAPDPAALPQQGVGGVKARSGGGMAGYPEDAKPGEKVGPPPAGGKVPGG
jgi:hypothetical protein